MHLGMPVCCSACLLLQCLRPLCCCSPCLAPVLRCYKMMWFRHLLIKCSILNPDPQQTFVVCCQVHALQDMEYENAWVRRPLLLFKEPMRMTLARLCWMSFILLLPLLRVLLPRGIVHKSLFQTIMANTTPYNTLHTFIRVSPFIWAGIMATLTAAVRSALRLVWA